MRLALPETSVVKNLEDLAQEKSRNDPKADLKTNALATSGMARPSAPVNEALTVNGVSTIGAESFRNSRRFI